MDEKTKQERCDYPGCMAKHTCIHRLDITNEENANVDLAFCEYHRAIVMGGRFTAEVVRTPATQPTEENPNGTPEKIDFKINGPLLEVEMAEQVVAAIEIAKRSKQE